MTGADEMDFYIELPATTFKQLSFSKATPHAIEAWTSTLPVADLTKTSQALYLSLGEIAELAVKPALKLQLLNSLESTLDRCLTGLRREFLNKPLILPEQAFKTANLCTAIIHRHQSIVYWIINQSLKTMTRKLARPTKLFTQALSLFFKYSLRNIVHQSLLYRPCEDTFWQLNHQMYQYAIQFKLLKKSQSPTINTAQYGYAQLLLWGAMNAHQLRQNDILEIEKELPNWTHLAQLSETPIKNSFLINLEGDNPPLHTKVSAQLSSNAPLHSPLYLGCSSIVEEISFIDASILQATSTYNDKLTSNLCKHLIISWSADNDRTFMRLESDDEIDLCIGLNCAHHVISGQKSFDDVVFGNNIVKRNAAKQRAIQMEDSALKQENLFNSNTSSTFEVALDNIGFHISTHEQQENQRYQNFNVNIVNISPGGYCLSWNNSNPPANIRNHELIAIRENHHPAWHLGSIKWVKQQEQGQERAINMGVELLSPSPQAYGARWINEKNKTASLYFKVLLLPEIKTMGQEPSIILCEPLPSENCRLIIEKDGKEQAIHIKKCLQKNNSFQHYSFVRCEILVESETSGTIAGNSVNDSPKDASPALSII
ncbi:MAG: hypothetical protein KAG18_01135 [Sinobacterium sp.]|nr:hypothetical protein [Sinobacterium sp.]